MLACCYYNKFSKILHIVELPFFYVLLLFEEQFLKPIFAQQEHLSFQLKFWALAIHELFIALFLFISKVNACHK
jgi:hypothetical protein